MGTALLTPRNAALDDPCTDLPPTPDGCPLEYDPDSTDFYMATEVGPASGDEILWSGQDMSQVGPFECAPYVVDPTFKVYVPEDGVDVTIAGHGTWTKVRDLPPTDFGVPQAEYEAPPGNHLSSVPFGQYIAVGGTIKGTCFTVHVRTGAGIGIYTGFTRWWDYTGNIERYSNAGDQEDGRGWAYDDTESGFDNGKGSGGDWQGVLQDFLDNDACTPGWEVWVNGQLRCDADGNHF